MEGKFYYFKPLSNTEAKAKLNVDYMYRQHPIIVIDRGGKDTIWVVTATSHPHFDKKPQSNFVPIHPAPTDGGSYDKPLTMKDARLRLPKNSWVVINSRQKVPSDSLREMMQGSVQYALDQSSLKRLRTKIYEDVCRQRKEKRKKAEAARKAANAEATMYITERKVQSKGEGIAGQQPMRKVDADQMVKRIAGLEDRVSELERVCERLNASVAASAIDSELKPPSTQNKEIQERPRETDAQLIAQETVHQMTTPATTSATRPAPARKRDSMKRLISKVWTKMPGTSSPTAK